MDEARSQAGCLSYEIEGNEVRTLVIGYASNTASSRNLAALEEHGWRILLTPMNPRRPKGFRCGIDNGAWSSRDGSPFDAEGFRKLLEASGGQADFVVIPDIVAGGNRSLDFSCSWVDELRHFRLLLLPVQDGMDVERVGAFLRHHPNVGIFLGGTTEYKLRNMYAWGLAAAALGRYYHVGRVNTRRRINLCAEAGANSFDGTSATRYSCTLPMLESARREGRLFGARTLGERPEDVDGFAKFVSPPKGDQGEGNTDE